MTTFLDKAMELIRISPSERYLWEAQNIVKYNHFQMNLIAPGHITFKTLGCNTKGSIIFEFEEELTKEKIAQLNNEDFFFDISSCMNIFQAQHVFEKYLGNFNLKDIKFACTCINKKHTCAHILAAKIAILKNLENAPANFLVVIIGGKETERMRESYLAVGNDYLPQIPFNQWQAVGKQKNQEDFFGVQSTVLTGKDFDFLLMEMQTHNKLINDSFVKVLKDDDNQESILGWLQGVYTSQVTTRFFDNHEDAASMIAARKQAYFARYGR